MSPARPYPPLPCLTLSSLLQPPAVQLSFVLAVLRPLSLLLRPRDAQPLSICPPPSSIPFVFPLPPFIFPFYRFYPLFPTSIPRCPPSLSLCPSIPVSAQAQSCDLRGTEQPHWDGEGQERLQGGPVHAVVGGFCESQVPQPPSRAGDTPGGYTCEPRYLPNLQEKRQQGLADLRWICWLLRGTLQDKVWILPSGSVG